jgi:hypothetical protein
MLTGRDDFVAAGDLGRAMIETDAASTWKRRALVLARALAEEGHFAWEDFRQTLVIEHGSAALESEHDWLHCQRWIDVLDRVARLAGLVDAGEIAALGRWAERAAAHEIA